MVRRVWWNRSMRLVVARKQSRETHIIVARKQNKAGRGQDKR
jgi:hypothetical protein